MGSIFKLTALAGVAAGAYAAVKKFAPNILPDKNEAEDMAKNAINSVKLTFPTDEKYSNGTALTPPMGWSSWNTFRNRIDEKLILETAEEILLHKLARLHGLTPLQHLVRPQKNCKRGIVNHMPDNAPVFLIAADGLPAGKTPPTVLYFLDESVQSFVCESFQHCLNQSKAIFRILPVDDTTRGM